MTGITYSSRMDARLLIARQVALCNGQQWDKLAPKQREIYRTLAENILATVERKASVKWN